MGSKQRQFAALIHVSLEELVPADHFYRHLEKSLDLSFVREFVQETYAGKGRPSIDPIVFFKLQLVMFLESIRSERQLMRHAADRLSVRWYVGYDLDEPLPDHSSLTRIRERYGVEVFRRFFEKFVELCQQAGLVWGEGVVCRCHQGQGQRLAWVAPLPLTIALARQLRSLADRGWTKSETLAQETVMGTASVPSRDAVRLLFRSLLVVHLSFCCGCALFLVDWLTLAHEQE
jgi:transposase